MEKTARRCKLKPPRACQPRHCFLDVMTENSCNRYRPLRQQEAEKFRRPFVNLFALAGVVTKTRISMEYTHDPKYEFN